MKIAREAGGGEEAMVGDATRLKAVARAEAEGGPEDLGGGDLHGISTGVVGTRPA